MEKHIEKEYKLLVEKDAFNHLLDLYPNIQPIEQINYYFDNANYDILKHHGAMRIREKQGTFMFTLKKFEDGDLYEYECMVQSSSETMLLQDKIQSTLDEHGITGPFHLIGTLKTERAMYIEENFELCFDVNYYGDHIDYEIEYEYRKEHDGFSNFNKILEPIALPFQENATSKVDRALHALNLKFK